MVLGKAENPNNLRWILPWIHPKKKEKDDQRVLVNPLLYLYFLENHEGLLTQFLAHLNELKEK